MQPVMNHRGLFLLREFQVL